MSRVVVIGAGLSGLTAASAVAAAGHDPIVVDKGRGVGGRLATRRIGDAVFDHGAQFLTVRSADFRTEVDRWLAAGVVYEWTRGFGDVPDGYPRYAGVGGMTSIAKHLSTGLDVRCSTLAFAVESNDHHVAVRTDTNELIEAEALIVTCPLPQSYSLLLTAGIELPRSVLDVDYDRTIALLAVPVEPVTIGSVGVMQNADPVFSMIVDNQRKGVSPVPAVTLHANPGWSFARWDDEHAITEGVLRSEARRVLGVDLEAAQVKRWRFATPARMLPEPCWVADANRPIVAAGDVFAGPKVEGAWRSGRAAAAAVIERLR